MDENIYQQNGYADRNDYMFCLAEILGKNEDFDGLVSTLEDAKCLL